MKKKVGDYEIGEILGEGSFGIVKKAVHSKTKEVVAIKIIDKEKVKKDAMIENLKKEVSILMVVDHPNIVNLKEVLASKTKIYLVLEYVSGGELWDVIKEKEKIGEDEARKYFRQIIRALGHCKSKTIAHRDIKPENMLITKSGDLKVADFGLSSQYKDPTNITLIMHTTCGTINYLAPEVIQNAGYDGHLADIWSTGVLLYVICSGYFPFEDDNISGQLEKIVAAEVEYPKTFSRKLVDLLKLLLNPNPKTRISLENILKNPWFCEKIDPEEMKAIEIDVWASTEQAIKANTTKIKEVLDETILNNANNQSKIGATTREINAIELCTILTGKVIRSFFESKELNNDPTCYQEFTTNVELSTIDETVLKAQRQFNPTGLKKVSYPNQIYTVMLKHKKNEVSFRIDVFEIVTVKEDTCLFFVNTKYVDGSYNSYIEILKQINREYFDQIRTKDKL